jgi:biopolymer transport protein ExbD/biopolymer transport protein TolR
MAITVNSGGTSGRRRFHGTSALSEINVTPFVDVVLVLLIIFMMTAHVMDSGIEVDVPKTKSVKENVKDLPIVKLTGSGEIYLNEKPVNINQLGALLKSRYRGQAAYLKADKAATWELVAHVMSALGEAGIQVNAVTQPEDSADKRGR